MLFLTNRHVQATGDATAFGTAYDPADDALGCATVARAHGGWALTGVRARADDDSLLQALVPLFAGPRPVLVYLHGNNNTPAASFERCARLEEIYGAEVVGFSWPSEGLLSSGASLPGAPALPPAAGQINDDETSLRDVSAGNRSSGWAQAKIQRYHRAKTNAQETVDAFVRALRLLTARLYANRQPLSLAAHSLGAHLLQYALALPAATEALSAARNVVLLSPCTRADGHAAWLSRIHAAGQVFVVYNRNDWVLWGASVADGQQVKLGTDPVGRLHVPGVRYVSFSNARTTADGHRLFVADAGKSVQKDARKLFGRILLSEPDLRSDELTRPRAVYPVNCDADGSTCYMARP